MSERYYYSNSETCNTLPVWSWYTMLTKILELMNLFPRCGFVLRFGYFRPISDGSVRSHRLLSEASVWFPMFLSSQELGQNRNHSEWNYIWTKLLDFFEHWAPKMSLNYDSSDFLRKPDVFYLYFLLLLVFSHQTIYSALNLKRCFLFPRWYDKNWIQMLLWHRISSFLCSLTPLIKFKMNSSMTDLDTLKQKKRLRKLL